MEINFTKKYILVYILEKASTAGFIAFEIYKCIYLLYPAYFLKILIDSKFGCK